MRFDAKCAHSCNVILLLAAAGICGALLVAGCKSETKQKWLTAFFDGVPSEADRTNKPVASAAITSQAGPTTVAAPVVPKGPMMFSHPPFVDHKCAECHEPGIGQ